MYPMSSEVENCRHLVEVTENEVQNSVHHVPKLDTLILVKAMVKNHSFSNPFKGQKAHERGPGCKIVERSNSAPDAYDILGSDRLVLQPNGTLSVKKGCVISLKRSR